MRKVLLFLLIFGAGLGILYLAIEKKTEPATAGGQHADAQKPEGFTEIPLPPEKPGQKQGQFGVVLGGTLDFTQFTAEGPTGKPLYELHADDCKAQGDNVYDLTRLRLDIHDVDTGAIRARLVSPLTRLRIPIVDGHPRIGETDRVLLTNVDLTLFEGAPVVPLTLQIPLLEWQLQANRFVSSDRVQLIGAGISAEGTGLDAQTADSTLRLQRDGLITITLEDKVRAELAATGAGPILVKRVEKDGESLIDLTTTEGARFTIRGEEKLELTAGTIHLAGHGGSKEKKEFDLVSADADGDVKTESRGDTFRARHADFFFGAKSKLERSSLAGDVVLQSSGDTFKADKAEFTFDARGRLSRADLVGQPSGLVEIGKYLPRKSDPTQVERELRLAKAEISGAGPLVLKFEEGTRIDLAGPGKLSIPELEFALQAATRLSGRLSRSAEARHRSGDLTAEGAVQVQYKGSDLETGTLTIHYSQPAPGDESVEAIAAGPTTLHGTPAGKGRLSLEAQGGLEVRSTKDHLLVPIARAVTITVAGEGALEAHADSVRDFDWDSQAFEAEGAVTYTDARGSGNAVRAVSAGRDDLALFGAPGAPAHYHFESKIAERGLIVGDAEAQEIHAKGDALDASGAVVATLVVDAKKYRLESGALHAELAPAVDPARRGPRKFTARATSGVHARFDTPEGEAHLACDQVFVDGLASSESTPDRVPAVITSVRAEGSVKLDAKGKVSIEGEGDLLTLDEERHGRLSAGAGRRVRAVAHLAADLPAYVMDAEWIEFDKDRLEGAGIEIGVDTTGDPGQAPQAGSKPALLEMSTKHFLADEHQILLEGDAHAKGQTPQGEEWVIDAGSIRVEGDATDRKNIKRSDLQSVHAWNGFKASFGRRAEARGEEMTAREGRVRIEGKGEKLAQLVFAQAVWESAWIQFELENLLLATDKGRLRPNDPEGKERWSVSYESLQPFDRGENTILVLRNPLFREENNEVRADWTLFWVDRDEWTKRGGTALRETAEGPPLRVTVPEPAAPPKKKPKGLAAKVAQLREHAIAKVLNELYLEGNIEFTKAGERRARASALYFDLKEGRGWVQDADMFVDIGIRGLPQRLRAKAKWLNVGADISLRADNAIVTSCEYDSPHYVIETGDLRLKQGSEGVGWDVSARRNAIRFGTAWAIPLPPLVYPADEKGNPLIENIVLGNNAKYGATVRAAFNLQLGTIGHGIGKVFGALLDLPKTDIQGHWKFSVGYLGSRGLLLAPGLEYQVQDPNTGKDRFRLELSLAGIPDDNEDRGLVRVPTDDRARLRTWFNLRGRYTVHDDAWWDLALSKQSDPGVQSEFFERDYLNYEQKDNYLHWRAANNEWYFKGSAKILLEDRTDIEELPSLGLFRGRSPIGEIGGLPVLYTTHADAEYLRRRDGDPQFYPPFLDGPLFPNGLGDREVVRFDNEHRFEAPFALGVAGVRATPFVSARVTLWDRAQDETESASRVGAFAGFDLATTFWKKYENGGIHTLSPVVGFHTDVATSTSGGVPVSFDEVEEPIEGRFVDLGLRSRWWIPESKERFDLALRATNGSNLAPGERDGLQPVSVLGEFLTFAGDIPIGITHDGRYDTRDGNTVYSRSFVGFEPVHDLGIEMGYHRGLDSAGVRLYEAASIATRFRATSKWELELEQSYSVVDNRGLDNNFTLRRLGHDFIMEIEAGYRAGEGSSFGIRFTPRLSWKRSSLGLIDQYLGLYH